MQNNKVITDNTQIKASREADKYIAQMAAKQTPYSVTISSISIQVDDGVYATGSIGPLFHKAILHPRISIGQSKSILGYGTGTGFLAIAAAKQGARVVAVDKNPAAIACATYNATANKVNNLIDFRISDCLSAI